MRLLVAQGIDRVESDKQRRREAVDLTFSNYADRFAGNCKGKGWKTLVTRFFSLHIKPRLREDKALPTITRTDVVDVFDHMPVEQVANRRNVFAVLRRLFKWAASRGDIERSPMEGMETPPPVKPRERWLSDEELRDLGSSLKMSPLLWSDRSPTDCYRAAEGGNCRAPLGGT